jgi:hypothetical protein
MWAVPGWALGASIREVRRGFAALGGPAWPGAGTGMETAGKSTSDLRDDRSPTI